MLSREVLKNIRRIHLHARFLVRDAMMGEYRSSFKGQGMEFDEVREYAPGDDVRHIDWNVTARTQVPHVKKFREERELTVFLVVDMSASGDFGTRARFKRELAAEIAAALAYVAIQNNDKVGVILFTDKIEKYIVPQKGRNHVLRVIRDVLAFEPAGHGTDFPGMLQFLSRVARRRAVVFLLSDFVADGYEKLLRATGFKHDLVAITLHDPMEDALPNVGLINLRDAETGECITVDTSLQEVRFQFEKMAREREESLANVLRRSRVERISVRSDQSYFRALVSFFERRSRVGVVGTVLFSVAMASGIFDHMNIAAAQTLLPVATADATPSPTPTSAPIPENAFKLEATLMPLKGSTADIYTLHLSLREAKNEAVAWPDFSKEFSEQDLRVVRQAEIPPVERDGQWQRGLKVEIAADLPGTFQIPQLVVKAGEQTFVSSAISFDVLSVMASKNKGSLDQGGAQGEQKKEDILDIKPIREELWPWRWFALASVVALLLLAALGWGLWKFSGRSFGKKAKLQGMGPDCHERALEALRNLAIPAVASLDGEQRLEAASVFYAALGAVFRMYLEDRFLIRATDMTSEELWPQVNSSAALREKVGSDTVSALRNFLFAADSVKFARAGAQEDSMITARDFVEKLVKQVREKDVEIARAVEKQPWRAKEESK
jgi:Mg-chelatase subunit ChlD